MSEYPTKIEAPDSSPGASKECHMNAERIDVMPTTPSAEASEVSMSTITPADKEIIDFDLKPEHFERLSKKHQQVFLNRAVPIEYALRYAVKSFDLGNFKKNRKDKRGDAFMGLPLHDTDGVMFVYPGTEKAEIPRVRFRADNTTVYNEEGTESKEIPRYLTQSGMPIIPWICHEVREIAADVSKPIYITEAMIKAMAMSAHGWPAIGLGGVSAGCHDSEVKADTNQIVVSKEWRSINWKGRVVYIVYDAGIDDNPAVAHGAAITATALINAGADVRFVMIPFWPASESDPENGLVWRMEDQGPDDYLARNGAVKMQELIDAAIPACPIARIESVREAAETKAKATVEITKLLRADKPLQAMIYVGGPSAITGVAAIAGVGKGPVVQASASFKEALVAKLKAKAADKGEEDRYVIEDGRICAVMPEENVVLCNFWAKIVSNLTHNDGIESKKYITLEGGIMGDAALPRIEVPADEFERMEWVIPRWGTKAIIRVGPKFPDRVREAIQTLSKDAKEETVYGHTGWRTIDGKPVFLHEGMEAVRMLKARNTDADAIEDGHAAYELPESAENVVEAVRASLGLCTLAASHVVIPALAAQYRAPLTAFLKPDFVLWFAGVTGTGKSAINGHCMRHWGPNWAYNKLKLSWSSTANSLKMSLNVQKDVPAVIDNYIPADNDRANDSIMQKCKDILQSIGDQASKGKLKRNSEAMPDRPPRGLVIVTGEDMPRGQSTVGRTFLVSVNRGDVSLDDIIMYPEAKAELLPHAMRAYIDWIAANWDTLKKEVPVQHRRLLMEYRNSGVGSHNRDPGNVAHLEIGFHYFVQFALEVGAITEVQAETILRDVREGLLYNAGEKAALAEQSSPTAVILEALRDGIATRKVHVAKLEDALPSCGINETALGWDEGSKYVYVLRSALMEAVRNHTKRTGARVELKSEVQLSKELAAAGILESDETVRPLAGGYRPRVLRMLRSHLADVLGAAASIQAQAHDQLQRDMDDAVSAEEIGKMLKRAHTAEQKPN